MKKLLILFASVFALSSFSLINSGINEIVNALKQNEATEVSKYFDNVLDIKLPNKEEVKNVGKNQAGLALKAFYSEQDIKSFDLTSQREMGGTGYLTGKLKGSSRSFNITLMIKSKGAESSIISVRIN